jgi:hypothetical protein
MGQDNVARRVLRQLWVVSWDSATERNIPSAISSMDMSASNSSSMVIFSVALTILTAGGERLHLHGFKPLPTRDGSSTLLVVAETELFQRILNVGGDINGACRLGFSEESDIGGRSKLTDHGY